MLCNRAVVWPGGSAGGAVCLATQPVRRNPGPADQGCHGDGRGGSACHGHAASL